MTSVSEGDVRLQPVERLIDEGKIARRVADLGRQITRDYVGTAPVFVGILKGCAVFMADLIRHVDLPLEVEFLSAASYSQGSRQDDEIRVSGTLSKSLSGRHVLLVEGIVETGRTIKKIISQLSESEPASIEIVTLLDKPAAHRSVVQPKYKGFAIGNEFVVGYGLDNTQKYRNLPYVGRVIENR